jgi:DNA topoisomerase-1
VVKKEGRLYPTELGILVNGYLVQRFPELINESFTAKMEADLDRVENGEQSWLRIVKAFYRPFKKDLDEAYTDKDKAVQDQPTEMTCELCGRPMVKRWGRHGWFYACSGYPECKNTKPMQTEEPEKTDEKCPTCGAEMVIRQGRYGRFLACSRYPDCKTTKPLGTGVTCPEDGGELIEKTTKKGKVFWSCSNWPECKFALWQKPVPESCPECGHPFLVEKKTRGKSILQCPNKKCSYKREADSTKTPSEHTKESVPEDTEPALAEG